MDSVTAYTHRNIAGGTTKFYRIRAENAARYRRLVHHRLRHDRNKRSRRRPRSWPRPTAAAKIMVTWDSRARRWSGYHQVPPAEFDYEGRSDLGDLD